MTRCLLIHTVDSSRLESNRAQPILGLGTERVYPNEAKPIQYTSGVLNLLKPNDIHICRTATLTTRRYILNIYSTNIHTEYFKHAA